MSAWVCKYCGYRINGGCNPENHECDPRTLDRYAARLTEIALDEFSVWLDTSEGQYMTVVARREVRK